MDFSGIFGGISSIIGASMSARAQQRATDAQIAALKEQRDFVYDQLDPNKIGTAALTADQEQAANRLRLQGQIDPQLLQTRYDAETKIAEGLARLGEEQSTAQLAQAEAEAGISGMQDAKKMLVDRAIQQLQLGASLPPDVQAELVRTGLEKSGMVTGAATPRGIGGTLLRKVIGHEGIALQKQREEQAQSLLTTAQDLESKRQNILQSLFPALANTQLNNLTAAGQVFGTANNAVPQAGLSGSDVANLWLSRVGATSANIAKQGEVLGQGALGVGNAWAGGVAGLARGVGATAASAINAYKDPFANPQY